MKQARDRAGDGDGSSQEEWKDDKSNLVVTQEPGYLCKVPSPRRAASKNSSVCVLQCSRRDLCAPGSHADKDQLAARPGV